MGWYTRISATLSPLEQQERHWGCNKMKEAMQTDPSTIKNVLLEFYSDGFEGDLTIDNHTGDLVQTIRRLARENKAASVFLAIPIAENGKMAGVMFHIEMGYGSGKITLISLLNGEKSVIAGQDTKLGPLLLCPNRPLAN